jgi:hypothetical protein
MLKLKCPSPHSSPCGMNKKGKKKVALPLHNTPPNKKDKDHHT